MGIRIEKWSDGLAVLIPAVLAQELRLEEGMQIEVTRLGDGLVLRQRKREHTLEQLLEQIKPENIHDETDWGSVSGREEW